MSGRHKTPGDTKLKEEPGGGGTDGDRTHKQARYSPGWAQFERTNVATYVHLFMLSEDVLVQQKQEYHIIVRIMCASIHTHTHIVCILYAGALYIVLSILFFILWNARVKDVLYHKVTCRLNDLRLKSMNNTESHTQYINDERVSIYASKNYIHIACTYHHQQMFHVKTIHETYQ